jgi:hypothetical protein
MATLRTMARPPARAAAVVFRARARLRGTDQSGQPPGEPRAGRLAGRRPRLTDTTADPMTVLARTTVLVDTGALGMSRFTTW